jgi:hypothetical protein
MENIDIFDKYYKNQMLATEKLTFENQLVNNIELKDNYAIYLVSVQAIKLNNLKKLVGEVHKTECIQPIKSFRFPAIKIAAAVVFGLLVYTGAWINNTDGLQVLNNNAISYIEPQQRGGILEKQKAEYLYQNKKFAEIITLYNQSNLADKKLEFLAAMANYNLKNYGDCSSVLTKITSQNSDFINEIDFYKIQCLVGLNKPTEALKAINELKDNNPYKKIFDWQYKLKLKFLSLKY